MAVEQQPMFQIRNILWLQTCSGEDTESLLSEEHLVSSTKDLLEQLDLEKDS